MKIVYFFLILTTSVAHSSGTKRMLRAYNIDTEIVLDHRMPRDPDFLKLKFRHQIELQLFEESKAITSRCEFKSNIGDVGEIRIFEVGDYRASLDFTTISNNPGGIYKSREWKYYNRRNIEYKRNRILRNYDLQESAFNKFTSYKSSYLEGLKRDKQAGNLTLSIYSQNTPGTSNKLLASINCTDAFTYHDLALALGNDIIFYVNPEVVIIE
ncbi:MAG: hypothetical protein HOE90_02495 [Bacteriovoracaceae bacterium]|jgi:hypothetical protein|nr:hypothetical protein [Bacteriovoracaceae bacterium]